ncbi:MAG: aspartyl/asparaginyl beta-hydroxylase domain-containing protein [Pseudomonadota bacterium]
MSANSFTRPTRGAVRIDSLSWDVEPIANELGLLGDTDWKSREYGTNWSDVALFVRNTEGDNAEHPMLEQAPSLRAVLEAFPADVIDMCLASLEPGGVIKEHRDISGGTAANVIRLHIPIVTHPDVAFYVSGERITMAAGEVWHLDTTYPHRVTNESDVNRIHLIIDLEETSELLALLPERDTKDLLHDIYFYCICAGKALSLMVRNPKSFLTRVREFIVLKFKRQSVLYKADDIK